VLGGLALTALVALVGCAGDEPAGEPPDDPVALPGRPAPELSGVGSGPAEEIPTHHDEVRSAEAGRTSPAVLPALTYEVPAGWRPEAPASRMRIAQWALPGGGEEDASLVLFYFGRGQGGSVSANLDRWAGQFVQPDGRPSREAAVTRTFEVNGLACTVIDVSGRYVTSAGPMGGENRDEPGWRMLAAVVETPGGPVFPKLVGPEGVIARWEESFDAWLAGCRWEGSR
jgi:hypothetical protein